MSLDAISLAAAIVQFADHARQLTLWTLEVYNSVDGSTSTNSKIEAHTKDIQGFLTRLDHRPGNADSDWMTTLDAEDREDIQRLADDAKRVSTKLLSLLTRLRANKAGSKTKVMVGSILKSFHSALKESEIKTLQEEIKSINEQINQRFILVTPKLQSKVAIQLRETQKSATQQAETLQDSLNAVRRDVLNITLEVHRSLTAQDRAPALVQAVETQKVSRLAELVRKLDYPRHVLQSLKFSSMESRDDQIERAYEGTSDWLKKCQNFLKWLEVGDGIFWISGKPGSGKSTLMKHILKQEETANALRKWVNTDNSTLIVAQHFFWISGDQMQQSIEGLYRTLLHQILGKAPDLVSVVCPAHAQLTGNDSLPVCNWDLEKLEKALQAISDVSSLGTSKIGPFKLCLFIDGLDEYHEAGMDDCDIGIVRVIERLVQTSRALKVCVSSRPWTVFQRAFERRTFRSGDVELSGKLNVEDFTKTDMEKFAWEQIVAVIPEVTGSRQDVQWKSLSKDIAARSEGVWIWTRFVVKSMLGHIARNESFESIRAILGGYPADLDGLYERIMGSLGQTFRKSSGMILSIISNAVDPIFASDIRPLLMDNPDPIHLALNYQHGRLDAELNSLEVVRDRLHNRCKDFLEIVPLPSTSDSTEDTALYSTRVDFIHRTVADFLRLNYTESLLDMAGPEFCPRITAMALILIGIKVGQASEFLADKGNYEQWFRPQLYAFYSHARRLDYDFRVRLNVKTGSTSRDTMSQHQEEQIVTLGSKHATQYHYSKETSIGRKFESYVCLVSQMERLCCHPYGRDLTETGVNPASTSQVSVRAEVVAEWGQRCYASSEFLPYYSGRIDDALGPIAFGTDGQPLGRPAKLHLEFSYTRGADDKEHSVDPLSSTLLASNLEAQPTYSTPKKNPELHFTRKILRRRTTSPTNTLHHNSSSSDSKDHSELDINRKILRRRATAPVNSLHQSSSRLATNMDAKPRIIRHETSNTHESLSKPYFSPNPNILIRIEERVCDPLFVATQARLLLYLLAHHRRLWVGGLAFRKRELSRLLFFTVTFSRAPEACYGPQYMSNGGTEASVIYSDAPTFDREFIEILLAHGADANHTVYKAITYGEGTELAPLVPKLLQYGGGLPRRQSIWDAYVSELCEGIESGSLREDSDAFDAMGILLKGGANTKHIRLRKGCLTTLTKAMTAVVQEKSKHERRIWLMNALHDIEMLIEDQHGTCRGWLGGVRRAARTGTVQVILRSLSPDIFAFFPRKIVGLLLRNLGEKYKVSFEIRAEKWTYPPS